MKQTRLIKKDTEWKDMPEFYQEKQKSYHKIIVRFDSEDDINDFSELIGQKVTCKTKSIWYPFKSHWNDSVWRWIDES